MVRARNTRTVVERMHKSIITRLLKNFMKNIIKVLKTALIYDTNVVSFIKENPALKIKLPGYDIPDSDSTHRTFYR